ncbi:4Fe-4S binding protein [Methanoplanus endosymbiosus]|uniref:4Fe-4S binding protein n=1 Tax=Methanoplanus endosymbiosus TaxID=33865 RepID=A0A9E7TIX7_9EURY|nr:4Fe-4S dicluster domain-containing protein [Methanoplanus endosymbiosus]UUX93028.1 4Fe-4S binding protein [Methanoplanus endosymbiosus]
MVIKEVTTEKHAFIDVNKCVLCGSCQEKCPESAIVYDSENDCFVVLKGRCIGCGICIKCCPYGIPELRDII